MQRARRFPGAHVFAFRRPHSGAAREWVVAGIALLLLLAGLLVP